MSGSAVGERMVGSARDEIYQALVTYCRGVDRGDASLIRAAFHADAPDEHGPFKGTGWELADRLAFRVGEADAAGSHLLLNVYIEFDSDTTARVESYVLAHHPKPDASGAARVLVFAGRYLDRFERRDGRWKIAHRKVVSDWHYYTELFSPMPGYSPGRKGPSDPAYDLFPQVSPSTPDRKP